MLACPNCHGKTRVLETRTFKAHGGYIRRRRECTRCKRRSTSVETLATSIPEPFELAARTRFAEWLTSAARRILNGDLSL